MQNRASKNISVRFGEGFDAFGRVGPLRAAIDEEIRHGNEQLGRLGGDDAAFGELAGALLSFSGLFGGEFATLINAAAQLDELATRIEAQGYRPYVIPVGGSNALGALGYVESALEISQQCEDAVAISSVVVASGSAGVRSPSM